MIVQVRTDIPYHLIQWLTPGKFYDAEYDPSLYNNGYIVVNDFGNPTAYHKDKFIVFKK